MIKMSFIPMNLQLFADDSSAGGDSATPQDTDTSTVVATDEATSTDTPEDTPAGEQADGVTDTEKSVDEPATQPKQTAEQDRYFAENRRKLEAAEKRATDSETQRTSDREIAKKYGKFGVYSDADVSEKYKVSHGISTIAELEATLQREAREEQLKEYADNGIDAEMMNKFVAEHPDVKQARENNEALAESKKVAAKAEEDRFLVDSFNELAKDFPDMADAKNVPPEVWRVWQNGKSGISLKQAYVAVNYEAIGTKKADAAKQAALNNLQSKDHVRGNGQGTETDTTKIPDDVMEMYKRMSPKGTMEQFKKHYKASQNK